MIRLAEVHLIYAEATCELNGGTISDEDLDFSINKNRARARVAPLTNELIANVWDAGWFDHATGRTICKKMNMLDEIRRERACELFGEGFRFDDLRRWGIAHINLTGQKLGRHLLNTAYTRYTANDSQYFGQPCCDLNTYPSTYGILKVQVRMILITDVLSPTWLAICSLRNVIIWQPYRSIRFV